MKYFFLVFLSFSLIGTVQAESKKAMIKKLEKELKKRKKKAKTNYNVSINKIKKGKKEERETADKNLEEAKQAFEEAKKRHKEIHASIDKEIASQMETHKMIYEEELELLEESFHTKIKRHDPTRRRASKKYRKK